MMNFFASSFLSLGSASRDQVGGALSSAAVLRGGLGPPTPPLCRYAEYTTSQLLWTCPVSTDSLEILDLLGIVHQIDVGVVIV